jgi:imidazolonepropionase-like amidohydrolase
MYSGWRRGGKPHILPHYFKPKLHRMKNFYRFTFGRVWIALFAIAIPSLLQAQEEPVLGPVSRTYALTNVNIIQAPGRKVDMGTVVIKNGLIQNVGKNISIPADAIIIKADSMYVYAGFIDGLSRVGVTKPKEESQGGRDRERPKDPGNPPAERAGITPQNDVRNSLNPEDNTIADLRSVGFTTAQVVPYGGMLPGSSSIVLLGGSSPDNMVLVSKTALYSELTNAERVYPSTVIGVMAKWRELYRQASLTKGYESTYAANRNGIERATPDRISEAFYPVIDKKIPVLFKAEKLLDVNRVATLQNDLGFALTLAEVKEGWDVINKIKASKAKVFLSLELPEEKKKEEKKDDKKEGDKKEAEKKDVKPTENKPKTAADLEKEALEKRKNEFIAKYTGQASAFQKAGITYGFSTLTVKPKDIPANLRRMIAAGITEDQALAALTTTPAQLLGLSDRLGTIDNGKMANLVVSDKPYFNEKAKVRYVFVDGLMYKLEVKEEKKGDKNGKAAEVAGGWSYSADTPQGKSTGKIKIKKDGDSYTGTITSSFSEKEYEMKDIAVSGTSLSFYYNADFGGSPLKVEFSVTIDGSSFEGTMTAGNFGSFPVQGTKEP